MIHTLTMIQTLTVLYVLLRDIFSMESQLSSIERPSDILCFLPSLTMTDW